MKARGVHLQYRFDDGSQPGAEVHNPLFELLRAVHEQGSIRHAAAALGGSYRHVWGALKRWEATLGEPLVAWAQGRSAQLTPFAERLLWAETRARSRLVPHIEALRAELQRVLAEALDGTQLPLTVHASHDLALPLLQEMAAADKLYLELRFAGSLDALRSLAEGRCTVAGFHVPPLADTKNRFARVLKPLLVPGRHKLIGCMQRTQGLIVAAGNPLALRGWADAVHRGARFVARQPGSGTWLLTEHLLEQAGLAPAQLATVSSEHSHLAAAAAVAAGGGDAALGIEAAARRFGLDFVPLVDEQYHLVCLARSLEQPAVAALRRLLQQPRWAALLSTLPGYQPAQPGQVLSLTRALPWWRFRAARRPQR